MLGRRGDGIGISVEVYVSFRSFDSRVLKLFYLMFSFFLVFCVFTNVLDHVGYGVVDANRGVD